MRTLFADDLAARSLAVFDPYDRAPTPNDCVGPIVLDFAFSETGRDQGDYYVEIYTRQESTNRNSREARPEETLKRWTRLSIGSGPVDLNISETKATVIIESATWEETGCAILVAIAQTWRFLQLDEELRRTEFAIRVGVVPGHGVERRIGRTRPGVLRKCERAFRRLLLDLPRYERPLTDSLGSFASQEDARMYRKIARALRLPGWRNHIDERVEVVESLLASAMERRTSTAHLLLEMLIIVAIVGESLLHLYLAFAGHE